MAGLARRAMVLTVARVANYGLWLLSPIILVRILPVAEFGHYREFLLYASLGIAFAAFNINDSLLYFIPAHARSPWRVIGQTTRLVFLSSVAIVGVVVLLDVVLHGALIGQFLLPLAIYVLLYVNIDFWESYWLASHQSLPVFLYTTARLLARMVVVIVAALLTHDVATIVWALIGLEALRLAASAVAWKRAENRSEPASSGDLWREQLRYCLPWGTAVVIGMMSRNLGNIAVVKVLGVTALAYYTIGLYGEPIIAALRNSVSLVVLPEMVRLGGASSAEQQKIWRRSTVINCILLLPLCVLLAKYAEPMVLLVFGPDYRPAAAVLQAYALVIARECFDMTLPLRSANQNRPLVHSGIVGLLVNAVSLYFLLPVAGIVGAVVALAIGGFSEVAYLSWHVARMTRVGIGHLLPWLRLLKVACAALVAGSLLLLHVWSRPAGATAGMFIGGVVYALAFVGLLWLFRVEEAGRLWGLVMRAMARVRKSA